MRIIGLISGTSADGIDAALVTITGNSERHKWRVEAFESVPWSAAMQQAILETCRLDAPLQSVVALNVAIGEAFAEAARHVANAAGVGLDAVDAIASHGQTIWHQPEPFAIGGTTARGTLQIGEPSVIAARTGCWVVADFRPADMALGGQGAPLVPFADWALFRSERQTRALLNIGGIANVTLLPKSGSLNDVIAFDTGPGNMLLDALTVRATNGAQAFDQNGALAAQGTPCYAMIYELLEHPYIARMPPKSTGREEFGEPFAEQFVALAERHACKPQDWLATATHFVSMTILRAFSDHFPKEQISRTIAAGGGVHNSQLRELVADWLPGFALMSDFGLDADAKEAVAFALLGYETLNGRPSNVPAATGASGTAILGKIVPPPHGNGNFRLRLDKRGDRAL